MRRGGRGRVPIRRESEGAPGRKREERDENWLKKFQEGELDDLFADEKDEEDGGLFADDADEQDEEEKDRKSG
jgi:hypothetical protein